MKKLWLRLSHLQTHLSVRRLEADIHPDNKASAALLAKLGLNILNSVRWVDFPIHVLPFIAHERCIITSFIKRHVIGAVLSVSLYLTY